MKFAVKCLARKKKLNGGGSGCYYSHGVLLNLKLEHFCPTDLTAVRHESLRVSAKGEAFGPDFNFNQISMEKLKIAKLQSNSLGIKKLKLVGPRAPCELQ